MQTQANYAHKIHLYKRRFLLFPHAFPKGHLQYYVLPVMLQDVLLVVLAYLLAAFVRHAAHLQLDSGLLGFIAFSSVVTIGSMYLTGVYHRIWSHTSGLSINVLVRAWLLTLCLTLGASYSIVPRPVPLLVVVLAQFLIFVGSVAIRFRSRILTGALWRWRAVVFNQFPTDTVTERTLIVGAGFSGQDLAANIHRMGKHFKVSVVGFVDDDPHKQRLFLEERPVLGITSDIPRIVEEYRIDVIAVAIHNISGPHFRYILEICEQTSARIKVVPDLLASMKQMQGSELLRPVRPEDLIGRNVITTHKNVSLAPIEKRVIMITGAAGSIGGELSRQIPLRHPTKLILVDNNESGLHDLAIDLQTLYPQLTTVQALLDISDCEGLEQLFETHRPQIVFHAAAYKHVPMMEKYPNAAVKVNIQGTHNVASLSQKHGVERFVLVSTDKAVNPSSIMGASKRVCELIIKWLARRPQNKTLFTSVRFGNVLGSRGSVIPTFTRQIDQGGPITVTHPEMTRYFMSIPEAANLIIHAACLTKGGETFLLRMGETVRILELAERMIRLRGMRPNLDIPIQFSGIREGEKLHEQLYDTSVEQQHETLHPGIIQLEAYNEIIDDTAFAKWLNDLMSKGVDPHNALSELLYE
jgi:FlaA1/EpsC-like NDP-sugar epimerase